MSTRLFKLCALKKTTVQVRHLLIPDLSNLTCSEAIKSDLLEGQNKTFFFFCTERKDKLSYFKECKIDFHGTEKPVIVQPVIVQPVIVVGFRLYSMMMEVMLIMFW